MITHAQNRAAVEAKISRMLAMKPECFITHPAELEALNSMNREELNEFAAQRGWRIVRRLGGRQIEFYNDAAMRAEQ